MKNKETTKRATELGGDWHAYFAAAREAGAPEANVAAVAECAAFDALNQEINSPAFSLAVAALAGVQQEHAPACALVAEWAAATGHTGRDGRQSRACRIKKLMRYGLASAYADALRAEIKAERAL